MYQFSNFERAEIGPPRLPELADGFEGVLRVEKTFCQDTRFGPKFFCEFTVMVSNHPENPAGQRVIWKQDMTKQDVRDNALFQWAAGIYGVDRDDDNNKNQLRQAMQSLLHYAVNVNNDINNFTRAYDGVSPRYVCARAREGQTKQSNRDFTFVDFWPYVPKNGT
jgi:hypothetical protein